MDAVGGDGGLAGIGDVFRESWQDAEHTVAAGDACLGVSNVFNALIEVGDGEDDAEAEGRASQEAEDGELFAFVDGADVGGAVADDDDAAADLVFHRELLDARLGDVELFLGFGGLVL